LQREVAETISDAKGIGVQFILQALAAGIAFAKLASILEWVLHQEGI
jgi:hypothetical protein